MKILVITPENNVHDEIETCNRLLNNCIDRLHVRKPAYSKTELTDYLSRLDTDYYQKISVHLHHELVDDLGLGGIHYKSNENAIRKCFFNSKSFHSMNELALEKTPLEYGFLSPVFDSFSKTGYQSTFDFDALEQQIKDFNKFPLYALGGIEPSRVEQIKTLGFDGAVLMGVIWQTNSNIERIGIVTDIINA